MKKIMCMLLSVLIMLSVCVGCANTAEPVEDIEEGPVINVYDDGRARPSSCGELQVIDGQLCSESGEPVILRGVSSYGLSTAEQFINEPLFTELSRDVGINVFRLAMYTTGMGIVGYCTGGDQERLKNTVYNGVDYARNQDMYALIDWHVLDDGDPNQYIEEAKLFFDEVSEKLCDYNNVMYEICNEPNGVDWPTVKKYAEVIIPIIRENDPDSVIIVGNPDWSKDLESVMADPLDYDNIMYTFHFYSASHQEEWRAVVEKARENDLPVFVTEYGVTASSGGFPRDLEQADIWIDLLERENISYCMWSYSAVAEPCSALKRGALKNNGFTEEDYSPTGLWLLETIEKHNSQYNP